MRGATTVPGGRLSNCSTPALALGGRGCAGGVGEEIMRTTRVRTMPREARR